MFGREPALWSAALKAVLTAAMAFGLPISAEQLAVVMIAADALLAVFVRAQVTPLVGGDPKAIATVPQHLAGDGRGPS